MAYLVSFDDNGHTSSRPLATGSTSTPNSRATNSGDAYFTISTLSKRIDLLQSHFPMLWAEVVDGRTTRPCFQERPEGRWSVADVLVERWLTIEEDATDGNSGCETSSSERRANKARRVKLETDVIQREIDRMAEDSDPRTRPPWQITLVRRRGTKGKDHHRSMNTRDTDPRADLANPTDLDPLVYLLLAVDHTHFDGQAGVNFLSLLLRCPDDPILSTLPHERLADIPACEETLDIRPGWRQMISVMADKVFVPMLPGLLRRRVQGAPKWPGTDVMRSPMDVGWALTGGWVEKDIMQKLKVEGKRRGIMTLHPVLKAGFLVALWTVIQERKSQASLASGAAANDDPTAPGIRPKPSHEPFRIEALTPRSERDRANNEVLKHSLTNGNYVTNCLIDCEMSSETEFWTFAAGLADELTSERGIMLGRGLQGLMGYLPDGQLERGGGCDGRDDQPYDPRPTKWEAFFLDKAVSDAPFLVGLQISNLGYVSSDVLLPVGAKSISFGQGCAPFSSPVSFNVVGCVDGIRWTTCFRDGSAVTKAEIERMDAVAMTLFERLADGNDGSLALLVGIEQ